MPLVSLRSKWLLTLIILFLSGTGLTVKGNGQLNVAGAVNELSKPLSRVKIEVLAENMSLLHSFTAAEGVFELAFEPDRVYNVRFNKYGYQPILLQVNTQHMDKQHQNKPYEIDGLEVQMFAQAPTRGMEVFDSPIVRLKFDNKQGAFMVDQRLENKLRSDLQTAQSATRNYYIEQSKQASVHVDSAEFRLSSADFTGARYFLVKAQSVCEKCDNVTELATKIAVARRVRGEQIEHQPMAVKEDHSEVAIHELHISLENKEISKRTVKGVGADTEYFKITHNWGGTYYFKAGQPITSWNWQDAKRKN